MLNPENRRELKALVWLAWPIVGTQLLHLTMQVVDSVLVGHLGVDPLAAIGMASAYYTILLCTCLGFLSALGPLISRANGAGEYERAGHVFRQGWLVGLTLSAFLTIGNLCSPLVFKFMGQPAHLIPMATEYLGILAFAAPATLTFIALRQFTEGTSHTKPSVIISAVGAVLHLVLAYVLVYGKFGFPSLGTKGSAIGTMSAHWLMALALAAYAKWAPEMQKFRPWSGRFTWNRQVVTEIVRIGAPMSGSWLSEVGFFSSSTIAAGIIGTHALASHQIALNAASFMFMVPMGISFAVAIRVGTFAGAHDAIGLRRAAKVGLGLTAAYGTGSALLFLAGAGVIARLYTTDNLLLPISIGLLHIAGLFQVFDGIQAVSLGILRAMKDTRVPFLNTIIAFWIVGAPVGYALTFGLHWGTRGLWIAMVLGLAMASVLHWRRFQKVAHAFG